MSEAQQVRPVRRAPTARRKEGRCEPEVRDRVIHRAIAEEGAELRRRVAARLGPADPQDFPAVMHLYRAAVDHVRKSRGLPKSFRYRGKVYGITTTNFGRVKVMDGKGQILMSGGIGAIW